jgi:RimJ/RimL family protein N-acetyltransferase
MTDLIPLPPTPRLETERLILRPLRLHDAPAIQREFPVWDVVRHLHAGVPWPCPADGAETNVRECLAARERGEQFFWVLTLLGGDDQAIGRIDLRPAQEGLRDMRGFWLARAFWGRGLMTEAAERVTAYAFEDLGWPLIYLTNAVANAGSHRIKEKQGAELIDVTPASYVCGPGERETWILRRETWLSGRACG